MDSKPQGTPSRFPTSSLPICAPLSLEENENEITQGVSDGAPSQEEEGFEMASDPDNEVETTPKARVSGEDEVFEEEEEVGEEADGGYGIGRVSPGGELVESPEKSASMDSGVGVEGSQNPYPEERKDDRLAGNPEKFMESESNSVESAVVVVKSKSNSNLEESSKGDVLVSGGEDEKSIENGPNLSGFEVVEESQNPNVEERAIDDDNFAGNLDKSSAGIEEKKAPDVKEEAQSPVAEEAVDAKHVVSLSVAVEEAKEETTGPVVEVVVDSNPQVSVPVAVEEEKEETASHVVEEAVDLEPGVSVPNAVQEEKIKTTSHVAEEAIDRKPVVPVPVATEEEKDGEDSGNPVDAESNAASAEKVGTRDAQSSKEILEQVIALVSENIAVEPNELNSTLVKNQNDERLSGVSDSDNLQASVSGNLELEPNELKSGGIRAGISESTVENSVSEEPQNKSNSSDKLPAGIGGEGAIDVGSDEEGEISSEPATLADTKVAKNSLDALDDSKAVESDVTLNQETGESKVVAESKEVLADSDAKFTEHEPDVVVDNGVAVSSQEVGSQPVLAEDAKSRELVLGDIGSHEADDDENAGVAEAEEEEEGLVSDEPARVAILESSETAKQIIKQLEGGSLSNSLQSGFGSSRDYSHAIDGRITSDSDEEVDTDEEGDGKELFDSAALAALLKAATGASPDGDITISSGDSARIFSVERPAGLGSSGSSLRPLPPRSARPNIFTPTDLAVTADTDNNMDEEEKKLHERVETIRVKFLRLIQRLGHSPDDTVAAQVLYRLNLAEGIRRGRGMSRVYSLENAKKKALQLEAEGKNDLDFSCNILVLGKSGVGKSATINSIFGEEKSCTSAFEASTTTVREISGIVDGVKIRVIDTPGLKAAATEQAANRKMLLSIKKYTKKCHPDIVLYVDRLDTQTRDYNDLPLLRSITSALGSSIWFNAIVALTHAASAPPEGPNGSPLSYDGFVAQRSHVVQHSIRQAASDMRLMNPVALVENHSSCRRNREGERVLPNGLSWRPQMLLLCYSSKILSEANSLLKLQDTNPGKLFGFRVRSPPLPFLLSSLLQTRAHPKVSSDQGIDNGDSDIDLDEVSDSDQDEEEDEYDQLPPFKPLRKAQIAKLTKEQKKAYYEEYDYRVKLHQKKQWKEEIRRLKEMKKRGKAARDEYAYSDVPEDYEQDGTPASVPVPLPDMVLPPTFDGDYPAYRYRFLEPSSQLLIRPVLDTHGWDHDCGYDGVSIEENLALLGRFPAGVSIQITKDKKDFNLHLDSSLAAKHGKNGSTLTGLDIQSIGKHLAYTLRSETKFKNFKKNKTTGGISVTFLGESVATGLKVEDEISIGKRASLVVSTGVVRAQGDTAYGANLETRLREKDYPIGQVFSTLGLSLMRWRGDLALGTNLQSQFSVGRNSKVAVRAGLNNKLSGQICIKTSSSEQLQIAFVGMLPVAVSIYRSIWPDQSVSRH